MAETLEMRWHGRGGQGTVTAAKVLADACLSGGRYVQAFPEYGPERAGAPLKAYNRISDKELRMHCPVTHPKVVSVVDASLLDAMDVTEGATEDAVFVINTSKAPADIKKAMKVKPGQKVFTVDATKIALDEIGRALPNSPMLGAIGKITGLVTLEHMLDEVKKSFGKKFSEKIITGNLKAVDRGYKEVREG
ncbi:MAG: 2-oxoacid:acceptor oxidoreductase family protein [Nitrospiraceae bacterium]|nr:2-oxoacid:acceptor oxidoreductase family protein [Nitrospiraceae bacterium]